MLQRIQTIYLLIAILCNALMMFIPLFSFSIQEINYTITACIIKETANGQIQKNISSFWILIPLILSIFSMTIAMFSYHNRMKQIKLCKLIMAFQPVIIILAISWLLSSFPIEMAEMIQKTKPLSLIFPVVSMVWIYLAIKQIKKDDELVKSIDRIR